MTSVGLDNPAPYAISKIRLSRLQIALLVSVLLLIVWLMKQHLQNKVSQMESHRAMVLREQARLNADNELLSEYSPAFELLSGKESSATTRLRWEASMRDMVEQLSAQFDKLVLEAQRQLVRQPEVQGYHLVETEVEVEISRLSELSAYRAVASLARLPAYSVSIDSCAIGMQNNLIEHKQSTPLFKLNCHLYLHEIKRN